MGCQSSDPGSVTECVTFKRGQYTVCCMYAVPHLLPGGQKHAWTHSLLSGNVFKRKRNTSPLSSRLLSFLCSLCLMAYWFLETKSISSNSNTIKHVSYEPLWHQVILSCHMLKEEAGVFILRSYWKYINIWRCEAQCRRGVRSGRERSGKGQGGG